MPQAWSDEAERRLLLAILEPDLKIHWDAVAACLAGGPMQMLVGRFMCTRNSLALAVAPPCCLTASSRWVEFLRFSSRSVIAFLFSIQPHYKKLIKVFIHLHITHVTSLPHLHYLHCPYHLPGCLQNSIGMPPTLCRCFC